MNTATPTTNTLSAHAKTAAKPSGKSFSTQSIASTQSVQADLSALSQELAAFKRHGDPTFLDIQSFAERIWRANLSYETAVAKLEREKKTLTKQIDTIWGSFDTLIKPLWRVDDAIVPVYDELADIRIRLEDLLAQKNDAADELLFSAEVVDAQKRLHALEATHSYDGKFVPQGFKPTDKVPSGQAVVANLLAKCYRLVRMINESEDPEESINDVVDRDLMPIQMRLENVIRALKIYKAALFNKEPVEPMELTALQTHVDAIANLQQKDGHFLISKDGPLVIPAGQAVLHDMMEEAYDLVHDCLVELEERESTEKRSSRVENLMDKIQIMLDSLHVEDDAEGSTKKQALDDNVLNEGFEYIKKGTGTAVGAVEEGAASLASLVRAGFGLLGKAFGKSETMDPTLEPILKRLTNLKNSLVLARNERDAEVAERIRNDDVYEKPEGFGVRTQLTVLEEMDQDRDENGRFVNAEGGAPEEGQAQLKALLEECFMLAYELL
ncbi:hypothetical protein HDU98_000783 [Podochytrium sp. JEL0797]|nr:hypothetical protein HDU98_000783 [Podochytrium sp. JEL0797]